MEGIPSRGREREVQRMRALSDGTCPDAAIDEELAIDLDFCKGCGICANECPKKAITMVREEK